MLAQKHYFMRLVFVLTLAFSYTYFSTASAKAEIYQSSCPVPTGLFVLGIGQAQATLIWSNNSSAQSFDVRYRELGTSTWTNDNVSSTNLLVVRNLTPSTAYEFQVQMNCSSGSSGFSASRNFTTVLVSCAIPTGLVSSEISEDEFFLSWNSVSSAQSYQVRLRPVGLTTWDTFQPFFTSFTATGLTVGIQYEWQVQTNCLLDNSGYSASEFFTTVAPAQCLPPENISISNNTTNQILVNYDAVFDAQSYDIRQRPVGTTTWTSKNVSGTTVAVFNLVPSTTYELQVRTNCSNESSEYSASVNFNTADECTEVPTGLFASFVSTSQITMQWNTTPGALTYTLRHRESGTTVWTESTVSFQVKGLSGLNPGTEYELQVRTNCPGDGGPFSASVFVTTLDANVCGVPGSMITFGISETQATFTWSQVTEANSYETRHRETGSSTWINNAAVTSNIGFGAGLSPGTEYEWQVRSNCSFGDSDYSASTIFTTQGDPGGGGSGGINVFPYSESFEAGFGDWVQSTADDFDWTQNSGSTPSNRTGPSAASDGSFYAYVESSNPNNPNKTTVLTSSVFDLSAVASASLSFDYHMYGSRRMGGACTRGE